MQTKSAVFSFIAAVALSLGAAGVLAGPVAARSALDRDIELELLLIKPPVPEGSRLDLVLASQPHNMSLLGARNQAKLTPATAPSAYADLVFTAVTACRILDSRLSQGGTGPWAAGSTNPIKIGPYPAAGGGYATGAGAQGGSATGCGLDTLAGPGKIAVIMVAVSTVAQAGAGYLTFFSAGAPNPGATSVSQFYQPGYVQTSFVLIPSDLVGSVAASGFTSSTTEVIMDVTGYFAAPGNINLANSTAATGNILKGGNRFIHNFGLANTFIGVNAGNFTMSGSGGNTASGSQAFFSNTTGIFNTASGANALQSNTTGSHNSASGFNALLSNATGSENTASGSEALQDNTTGNDNTASGYLSLLSNTTGSGNTASGALALYSNTSGSSNIAIGLGAGLNLTTGNLNIDIGNNGVAAESDTIRIGTAQTRAFIAGISGVTTGLAGAGVLVDSNGQLGTISSSRRYKDDIADMGESSAALMRLRPVTFHYKSDRNPAGPALQYGLIAEEVAETYPGLVAYSRDGAIETVLYQHLPTMLLNEYQKQQRRIDAQASRIEAQTKRIAELETQTKRIAELEQHRQLQEVRLEALEKMSVEFAQLKMHLERTAMPLEQLQRADTGTAGLSINLKGE